MIDFACKKFNLEDVIRCSFNLSKAEFSIMKMLLEKKNSFFTTNDLFKLSKLDLSTVQRAVKKLYDLGIIQRTQTNISTGGYLFSYKIKPRQEIKSKVNSIISTWAKRIETEFDNW